MKVIVSDYEFWLCLVLYTAAFSFYMLHFLRSKIKYTKYDNEKKQKNQIVLCKTLGFMMIFAAAVFTIILFSL